MPSMLHKVGSVRGGEQIKFDYGVGKVPGSTISTGSVHAVIFKEPLIKYMMLLAYRLVRDQGMILKACRYLPKNYNAEHGQACKPLRARPEAHICHVAKLVKD